MISHLALHWEDLQNMELEKFADSAAYQKVAVRRKLSIRNHTRR